MGSSTVRSSLRIVLSLIVLAVFVVGTQGPALATTKVGQSGVHGKYHVADTKVKPGARCRYDGAAGTWYLQRIHVRAPTIYGTSAKHRSVGYRLLLQRRTAHGWKTLQRSTLISGVADKNTAATLTGATVVRDVDVAPNWPRYRAALKLVWWDAHAKVQGRVLLAIKHHRRSYDGSVTRVCPGRTPTGVAQG